MRMNLADVSLEDKYRLERGRIFLTGMQALARLPMLQHALDRKAGLHTAGYISGYRGSPLGGLDTALHAAGPFLKQHDISFQPGVNEDIAATAIWGTQQLHLFPRPKFDGIFSMWYGKGPGVDRCGDVFKHANHAGSARHGGVLLIAGDDPSARSSAVAHQSEHMFSACGIPVLAPADLQEYLDYGLHGWAMSRYSGCWVALKITSDTAESSATVEVDPERVQIVIPEDFRLPPDGVHIRWPDTALAQEHRLQEFKVYAAIAYARANKLNRIVFDSPRPRLGIIASGKAWLDVRQALDDLGIDESYAAGIGLRLCKVGMPWPLEADSVRHFAEGLEEILVVEEKRQIIEYQLKEMLYNWREDVRPRVVGKYDETGEWPVPVHRWLLAPTAELTPALVARAIAARIGRFHQAPRIADYIAFLDAKAQALARPKVIMLRTPWFCPGCPHNQSTKVPEGSCALGGVGCHLMAVAMGRNTITISQMGGEGAAWLGVAGHSGTQHIFANMGDGTYFHSGLLAIRAAVAAKINITYKLLFNDAVAMTGGQPLDGTLTVPQLTRQLAAEDVGRIIVMSDEPEKYGDNAGFAPGVELRHRDQLERTQIELRETPGVTALIYDQTCAAEKRRRRKRGRFPDPAVRIFINEMVCEGCGDCSAKSNCLAVVPVETELGRKRAIDQHACNKDYSCLDGFCPSIVTVHGGQPRRGRALEAADSGFPELPEPAQQRLTEPYSILIAGVGGTGVITIGALLGMAAHLEGKGVTVLDMTGLAQKGGAVMSHVRIAERQDQLHAMRIATGEARLLLGCDIVVAVGDEILSKTALGSTQAVVNTALAITGEFIRNPDRPFPEGAMEQAVVDAVGAGAVTFLDASNMATRLMGHSIATNIFMLGYAFQRGLVPLSSTALLRAIELNGAGAEANRQAFAWGRRTALDRATVEALLGGEQAAAPGRKLSVDLDEAIERRRDWLTDYQDAAYARRYANLVDRVRACELKVGADGTALSAAVARNYFKLLAYKDEYEVARLFADPAFRRTLEQNFEGDYRLNFHMTLPWSRGARPGEEPKKIRFGPWLLPAMKLLARFKFLRGTAFNPFGLSTERRQERELIAEYGRSIAHILDKLSSERLAAAVALASIPETIRGYGPIKERAVAQARARQTELMAEFEKSSPETTTQVA
ncbi:MAG: indolepyruvate ferredoxin oxidoreductase family protein [Sulfuritalea sp.]|nr:indolepyruvate ferredoxin oxidoreductase family protein [Sulfuritalea sp.]MDP1983167.1 indolepyruvate ferredoxin oxidoreductase family protein [Sulfuritalea sp.]